MEQKTQDKSLQNKQSISLTKKVQEPQLINGVISNRSIENKQTILMNNNYNNETINRVPIIQQGIITQQKIIKQPIINYETQKKKIIVHKSQKQFSTHQQQPINVQIDSSGYEQIIQDLKSKIQYFQIANTDKNNELNSYKLKADHILSHYQLIQQQNNTLSNEISVLNTDNVNLKTQISSLNQKLADSLTENQKLIDTLDKFTLEAKQYESLKNKYYLLDSKQQDYKHQIDGLLMDIKQLNLQIKDQQLLIDLHKQEQEKNQKHVDKLKDEQIRINNYEIEIEKGKKEKEYIIYDYQQKIDRLENNLNDYKQSIDLSQQKIIQQNIEIEKINKILNQRNEESEQYRNNYEQLLNKINEYESQENRLNDYAKRIANMSHEIQRLNVYVKQKNDQYEDCAQQLQHNELEYMQLEQQCMQMTHELEEYNYKMQELYSCKDKIIILSQEIERQQQLINDYEHQLNDFRHHSCNNVGSLSLQLIEYQSIFVILNAEIDSCRHLILQKQIEIDNLKKIKNH